MPPVTEVAHFSNPGGWAIDNFEGLTRHRDRPIFMVSDDGAQPLRRWALIDLEPIDLENDTDDGKP